MKDYHIHPSYSIDAKADAEDYVKRAIEIGIDDMCFTTHIDLNPARMIIDRWVAPDGVCVPLSDDIMYRYRQEIDALAEKYKDSVKVHCGYEFSYAPHFENEIIEFLEKFPADFTIGSIHCIDNIGFTASSEADSILREYTPATLLPVYADLLRKLAESNLFDTIGHIDGYKKYAPKFWNMSELRDVENEIMPDLFKKLGEIGMGFELNTSAVRKGHKEFYPSRRLLEMAKSNGANVNSIGSDSHRINQLGFMLNEGYALLEEIGFELD